MDRITKALLKEFTELNSLTKLDQSKAFEHFCSYILVAQHYDEGIDTQDIVVGGNGEIGIDAIAIIVNGSIVSSYEEVEELRQINGYVDASFILIQSETSQSFDLKKLGHFGDCAKDFFEDSEYQENSTAITRPSLIVEKIFNLSSSFKRGKPQCFLYYATTGKYLKEKAFELRRQKIKSSIEMLGMFRKVEIECIDSDNLHAMYNSTKNTIKREILFEKYATMPEMPGVTEAYIGALPAFEFLKLIEDENGGIIKSVFNDNVRDWQDLNTVNEEIGRTLENNEPNARFAILNNGVTVIAKYLQRTGDKFNIEDYQIVNGCQTSHVLHLFKTKITEKTFVPLRLISTTNDEISAAITKATNRQTQVTEEELLAVSDFQKKLEVLFSSYDGKKKLFYERRTRQYNHVDNIEKVRIINKTTLIRAFSSIYLEKPHRTQRGYATLISSIGKDIFEKNHILEAYYASAYTHYKLDYAFRNQIIDSKYKPARYLLLMAIRTFMVGHIGTVLNSKAALRTTERFIENLWDDTSFTLNLSKARELIDRLTPDGLDRDQIHTESFTNLVIDEIRAIQNQDQICVQGELI
ncbi:AIPR protein [Pseudomonas sp. 250J]|uniref:AIPR family protein n=1 Tax=unclassified Pseudomonas TaxID=196821 RepID=UPI000682CE00|nr:MULTISPECIES: AIPR family protein [unclassified Pseudomonas]KNX79461.1 AIPR protein [Pseudomonas sp. 250J]QZA53303.1 AIPR family protein [Pseudomonas sp. 2hn]